MDNRSRIIPLEHDDGLERTQRLCVLECQFDAVKSHWEEIAPGVSIEPHRLMKAHPICCGLKEYYLKYEFHQAAVAWVNCWGYGLSAAHLYGALRRENLVQQEWTDMEFVFHLQCPNILVNFEDREGGDHNQYLKRFLMSLGFSASNFARDRRHSHITAKGSYGRRLLLKMAPMWTKLADRYVFGAARGERRNMSIETIRALLESTGYTQTKWSSCQFPIFQSKTYGPSLKLPERQTPKLATISSIELLTALETSLRIENIAFTVNYFALDRQCFHLLRAVTEAVTDDLEQIFGRGLHPGESWCVTGDIFTTMSTDHKRIEDVSPLRAVDPGFKPSRKLLEKAAKVYNDYFSRKSVSSIGQELWNLHRLSVEFAMSNDAGHVRSQRPWVEDSRKATLQYLLDQLAEGLVNQAN